MPTNTRRIVTGHNANGKAIILHDTAVPVFLPKNRPGVEVTNVWLTTETPAKLTDTPDSVQRQVALTPPPHETVFRIVEFSPEKDWIEQVDRQAARESFASFGAEQAMDDAEEPRHPFMHKTETIDYAIVLSGECYMLLDNSEILVTAGDIIIQRGTNHAWSNRSDLPCRIAFVLIDGTGDGTASDP
jgi:oxalate decarboxylase/phosphoglucose isomerase-like protein (cupin superfamily)